MGNISKTMTNLPIPSAAVAAHTIALGKTRSGKSSVLRLIVEALLDADKPPCIIDPKGDWWGLKSSASGKRAGYPVIIFGGEHADVPLNPHAGAHVAELIATGNRPAIIDLGGWMVGERTRFFIEFASTLFRLTRGPRWLVMDECHNFCPQGKIHDPDAGKMLHWANRLASEGAGRGLTLLSASQRPQKVHKDYLTSHETLIAMRVIHALDRHAVRDWIDACGEPEKGKEVLATLASMKRGQAWVYSPEIGFGPACVQFPMFKTYDSFKAPESEATKKLKGWASVDLKAVTAKLAHVVEEAKANDPKELRAEIGKLKAEIGKLNRQAPVAVQDDAAVVAKRHSDAVYKNGYRDGAANGWVDGHAIGFKDGVRASFARAATVVLDVADEARKAHNRMPALEKTIEYQTPKSAPRPKATTMLQAPVAQRIEHRTTNPKVAGSIPAGRTNGEGAALDKPMRAILNVLAATPDEGVSRAKVALVAGYSASGGAFGNALSRLRTGELIRGSDPLRATPAGLAAAGDVLPLPSGPDLLAYWVAHPSLGKAARDALKRIVAALPGMVSRETVAAETGYEASGGAFGNGLSSLRTLGLISGSKELQAAGEFS